MTIFILKDKETAVQSRLLSAALQMKKGEKIAIVGATGSGKSTILKLITKMYADYSGSIQINGQES